VLLSPDQHAGSGAPANSCRRGPLTTPTVESFTHSPLLGILPSSFFIVDVRAGEEVAAPVRGALVGDVEVC
jgi:hypothetical protein